jgi:hypothetical protein
VRYSEKTSKTRNIFIFEEYIMDKKLELLKYSDVNKAQKNAFKYLGKDAILYISPRKNKKYRIYNPNENKWVDFGSMNPPMEDYTKHKDKARRERYLKRALNIKGNWKDNKYSPNQLSINILWN